MEGITLELAVYTLLAGLAAAAIRLHDTPKDKLIDAVTGKIQWVVIIPTVAGCVLMATVVVLVLGYEVAATAEGFIATAGVAMLGVAGLKSVLGIKPPVVAEEEEED